MIRITPRLSTAPLSSRSVSTSTITCSRLEKVGLVETVRGAEQTGNYFVFARVGALDANNHVLDIAELFERKLDSFQFDSETANFHLVIYAPKERELAAIVGEPSNI